MLPKPAPILVPIFMMISCCFLAAARAPLARLARTSSLSVVIAPA